MPIKRQSALMFWFNGLAIMAFWSVKVACGPFPWNSMFQVISLEEPQGQGEQVAFVGPSLLHTHHVPRCRFSKI